MLAIISENKDNRTPAEVTAIKSRLSFNAVRNRKEVSAGATFFMNIWKTPGKPLENFPTRISQKSLEKILKKFKRIISGGNFLITERIPSEIVKS